MLHIRSDLQPRRKNSTQGTMESVEPSQLMHCQASDQSQTQQSKSIYPFPTKSSTPSSKAADMEAKSTANQSQRSRRKRLRDEMDETDYVDGQMRKPVQRDVSHAQTTTKQISRAHTSLGDLPAELLELIAWFSLSPILPLVSKKIFQKLGHLRILRRDMALLVFCNWEEVHQGQNIRFPSYRLLVDISPLRSCMHSPVALSSSAPTLNMVDLQVLRNIFGEMRWCDIPLLRAMASEVMELWLDYNFLKDELDDGWRKYLTHFWIQPWDLPNPVRAPTRDSCHTIVTNSAYATSIVCSDGRGSTACPHYATRSCPKNKGSKLSSHEQIFATKSIFVLPRVPERVLCSPNDASKEADMTFYQRKNDMNMGDAVNVSPDWSRYLFFRRPVLDAIATTIEERQYRIFRRLLLEKSPRKQLTSVYSTERPRTEKCIPGQLLLSALAQTYQWQAIMNISKILETQDGPYGRPTKLGPEAAGEHLTAIVLTFADEAMEESNDEEALKILEWWIKDPRDFVPDSWNPNLNPSLLSISFAAINNRAVKESNRNTYEKVERIRRMVQVQNMCNMSELSLFYPSDSDEMW